METISHELRAGVMSMPHVHNETFMSNGHEVLEDDLPAEDEFDLPFDEDSPRTREDSVGDFLALHSTTNHNHSNSNRNLKPDRYENLRVQFPNDEHLSPEVIDKVLREQKQALGLQLQELETIEKFQSSLTRANHTNGVSKQLSSTTWEQKLQPYLNTEGGIVDPQYISKLMQLLSMEKNTSVLVMFAKALLLSNAKVHKRFVDSDGLKKWLRKWLGTSDSKLIQTSLKLFTVLPMTEEQFKASHLEELVTSHMESEDASIQAQAFKAFKKIDAIKKQANSTQTSKSTTSPKPTSKVPPPKQPAEKQKLTPSNESIFGGEDSGSQSAKVVVPPKTLQKRIAPDYIKPRKHKMQVVDMEEAVGKENVVDDALQKKKATLGSEKPLSADAIKKAKLKEKYLDNSASSSSNPPLSPPSVAPEPTGTTIQPPTQSPPLSAPVSHPEPVTPSSTTISSASGYPIEPPLKKQRLPPLSVPTPSVPTPSPAPEIVQPAPPGEDDEVWNVASNAPPEEEIPFEPPTPYSKKTGKLKKKVTWVTDDKLEACKYFFKESAPNADDSLTPTSDAAPVPLHAMSHAEFEKHRLEDAKRERAERANGIKKVAPQETVRWRAPPLMDIDETKYTRAKGEGSKQVAIQTDREMKVLSLYFIDETKTPTTPSEPDTKQEEYDDSRVKIIPFEDFRNQPPQQQQRQPPQQMMAPQQQQVPQQQARQPPASSAPPSFDPNALSSLLNQGLAMMQNIQRPLQQMQPQMQSPQMQAPLQQHQQQQQIQQQQIPQQVQQLQAQQQMQAQQLIQQQLQQMQPQQLQQLQQLMQMQGMNQFPQLSAAQVNNLLLQAQHLQQQQIQQQQMQQQQLQQQQQMQQLQAFQALQQNPQLLGLQMPGNQPGLFPVNMQQLQQFQQLQQLNQVAPAAFQNINPSLINSLLQNQQQSGQPHPQSFPQQQQHPPRYRS